MPTLDQIRAARALLNWSQTDLADRAGLSQTGIARIESGVNQPNTSTLDKIEAAFANAGIEFIADRGVERRRADLKRYRGQKEFRAFFDDIYETARDMGGHICLFNGVPALLEKWLGSDWYAYHAERMKTIKTNFDFRVIVKEGERALIGKGFAQYRGFPQELFHEKTIYVYGNKIAFLTFTEDDVAVVVVDEADAADSFRILFNAAWDHIAFELD
jgi:transcriptional regulator with XRE-family HTH domain